VHDWCAAFVDWCVQQLLLNAPNSTSLTLAGRPKTASAWGLLQWGDKSNDCDVMTLADGAPARGDIAVFTFHHTGIITEPDKTGFQSVEGNTTRFKGGNQGFGVFKRRRSNSSLKGFIRLKPKFNAVGDFEFSSQMLNKA
jgi:hypothetical protein